MENKVFVYVAVGVMVAIIAFIAVLPGTSFLKNMIPQNSKLPSALTAITAEIKPIDVKYNGSSILSISDRNATIQTKFVLTNPNTTTVIVEMISYDIYADGVRVGHGQYGERYSGSWESSYYLPLTKQNSETVSNSAQFQNDGNNPQVWSALQKASEKLIISGTIFYSTNTAFTGQSLSSDFNFTQ